MKKLKRTRVVMDAETVRTVYQILAGDLQWPGRGTLTGQALLCTLRNAVAYAEARPEEDVQDDYSLQSLDKLFERYEREHACES